MRTRRTRCTRQCWARPFHHDTALPRPGKRSERVCPYCATGMPILHKAHTALGCTIAVWHGTLTSEDMTQQLMRLADDPEWPPGPHHLVDGTTLEAVAIPDPE